MLKKEKNMANITSEVKKFYVSNSMANMGTTHVKKGLQTIALCLLSLESKAEDPFIIRDLRNMIFDLSKTMNKDEKQLMKELLKLIK